jgi:hypothetical protein
MDAPFMDLSLLRHVVSRGMENLEAVIRNPYDV